MVSSRRKAPGMSWGYGEITMKTIRLYVCKYFPLHIYIVTVNNGYVHGVCYSYIAPYIIIYSFNGGCNGGYIYIYIYIHNGGFLK